MKKAEVTRGEILELINEFCNRLDTNGLICVLEMAHCCWAERKREREKRQETAGNTPTVTMSDDGKIFYIIFPASSGHDRRGQ